MEFVEGRAWRPSRLKPFDLLVEGNETENWLGGRDSCPVAPGAKRRRAVPEAVPTSLNERSRRRASWLAVRDGIRNGMLTAA
jgi:hypothetical protein